MQTYRITTQITEIGFMLHFSFRKNSLLERFAVKAMPESLLMLNEPVNVQRNKQAHFTIDAHSLARMVVHNISIHSFGDIENLKIINF